MRHLREILQLRYERPTTRAVQVPTLSFSMLGLLALALVAAAFVLMRR